MFVSSYSTYISSNSSQKNSATKTHSSEVKSDLFSSKIPKSVKTSSLLKPTISANYISQERSTYNKQLIELKQNNIQNEKKEDFKTANNSTKNFSLSASLLSARVAYSSNSKMFSLLRKPVATLNQTPTLDTTLPKNVQEIQEKNMRNLMVNTYLANDNYYKITA